MAKAKRKRATGRRRTSREAAANPRRRRHSRRRNNPGIVRRRRRAAAAVNPRRRRHARQRNPSAANIGAIIKNMAYGSGGAILTRVGSSLVGSFVPASLSQSAFAEPTLQAIIAVTAVRMLGGKFLGKPQGDVMMLGGLISAGLNAADRFLPNIQGQLTGMIRAPVAVAPGVMVGAGAPAAALAGFRGYADVEDINYQAEGFGNPFGDVEDVQVSEFNSY